MRLWLMRNNLMQTRRALLLVCCLVLGLIDNFIIADPRDALLVDAPLVTGRTPRYLDGDDWQISSTSGLSFRGNVPGDLVSDMYNAKLIPDPLFANNFKGADWDKENFVYAKHFQIDNDNTSSSNTTTSEKTLLVFDGIKMAARVSLNGQELFIASNQFVRYIHDVSSLLPIATSTTSSSTTTTTSNKNILQIEFFPSSNPANEESRWMACSGAWDWAPFCETFSSTGSHTFTKGLWKSVYLLKVPLLHAAAASSSSTSFTSSSTTSSSSAVVIEHVVPHVYYKGRYPSSPLTSDNVGPFEVLVSVHLLVQGPIDVLNHSKIKVLVRGDWEADKEKGKGKGGEGGGEGERDDFEIVETEEEESASSFSSSSSLRKIVIRKRIAVEAGQVRLWWPSGMGEQTQYDLSVSLLLSPSSSSSLLHINNNSNTREENEQESKSVVLVEATRKIAFRVAYLVTDDAAADEEEEQDGTGTYTMRLNINGAALFARGANVIPMDELEGRVTSSALVKMLVSAKQAHFNMLRVWGGGVFFPDLFYSTCDELGLLVWQDLMFGFPWFGGNSGVPVNSPLQRGEIKHQMRRLSHHASIVVWNTCNECQGDQGAYASFVSPLMASEDPSRIIWPASPSLGWQSGVDRKTGLANGLPVVPKSSTSPPTPSPPPPPPRLGCNPSLLQETHGPYQHGEGFKTVDSEAKLTPFDPNVPPALDTPTYVLGPQCPGTIASEFGASVMSSFESMSQTLPRDAWGLHVDLMHERNYATDNFLEAHFPLAWPKDFLNVGEDSFKGYLYMSMLSQALVMKSDISTRRARNSFALLVWQLNEIWPTGGWGSLEYGSATTAATSESSSSGGQIVGGRWKPLHYFYKQHLFTALFVTCGADARCLVRNDDSLLPFTGLLDLRLLHLPTGAITPLLLDFEIKLSRGGAAAVWLCANGKGDPFSDSACTSWNEMLLETAPVCTPIGSCMLLTSLSPTTTSSSPASLYSSFELLAPLKATIPLLPSNTSVGLSFKLMESGEGESSKLVDVIVTTQATALFVTLTTLAQGQFEENAFCLAGATSKIVTFTPAQDTFDMALFKSSLRVEHVMTYF